MLSYNGYTSQERTKKSRALIDVRDPWPPCALCGDPEVTCEYHSEDYSKPYRFKPPAMHALCHNCHISKLHGRFKNPDLWEAFKAHVRRGGYAEDLKEPAIAKEFAAYRKAMARGESTALRPLRRYRHRVGREWWSRLSTDARTLTARSARPRP
jgi:hypothetical protein